MSVKANNVIVGMSGGIDSSVAAALLLQQGYKVTGAIMKIWDGGKLEGRGKHGCYGPEEEEDIEDARRVAHKLGIAFHVIDLAQEYHAEVLDYFCHEYLEGRTPNPCVRCNRRIKFGALVEKAASLGIRFDYFATGHYARIEKNAAHGRYLLKKGRDAKKDQSYFLYSLSQQQLAHTLFPLGDMLKSDVRKLCVEMGLGVENRQESQNFVCGRYTSLFEEQPGPGPLMDKRGKLLGRHKGIIHYTLGQRKKLGVTAAEPLFVVDIKPDLNAVIVGGKDDLRRKEQVVGDLNWIAVPSLDRKMDVKARIRSSHGGYAAVVSPLENGKVKVAYTEPQVAAARGQAIVFYVGDVVIGGGIVE